jgi:hypothetical protein
VHHHQPAYHAKDHPYIRCTDLPLLTDQLRVVELIVYDKDMLSKEYLRMVVLFVEDWFANQEGGLFDNTGDGSQEKC